MKPGGFLTRTVSFLSPNRIEPMLNASSNWKTMDWPDDWTVTTVDGASSAAAEETLLVTEEGIEILTAAGGPKKIDTREARKEKGLLRD